MKEQKSKFLKFFLQSRLRETIKISPHQDEDLWRLAPAQTTEPVLLTRQILPFTKKSASLQIHPPQYTLHSISFNPQYPLSQTHNSRSVHQVSFHPPIKRNAAYLTEHLHDTTRSFARRPADHE